MSCSTQYAAGLDAGPPPPVRELPVRRPGSQGRRRRQRRDSRLDLPARRPRRPGPAGAAGQGGPGLGPRALSGSERVSPTTASGSSAASGSPTRRPTSSSAGSAARASTATSTTSTSASSGTGRRRSISRLSPRRGSAPTPGRAAGRWRAPTPGRAIALRSRPTWATGASFDRAIARFATAYADQNERDYWRLADAVATAEVAALAGV